MVQKSLHVEGNQAASHLAVVGKIDIDGDVHPVVIFRVGFEGEHRRNKRVGVEPQVPSSSAAQGEQRSFPSAPGCPQSCNMPILDPSLVLTSPSLSTMFLFCTARLSVKTGNNGVVSVSRLCLWIACTTPSEPGPYSERPH